MPSYFANRPFDKLQKRIDRLPAPAPAPPAAPQPAAPPSDEQLFSEAMSDVREIEGFRVLPCVKAPRRKAPGRPRNDPDDDALQILEQIAQGRAPINLSDTQEFIEWTNAAHHQGLTADLHAGRFSVQGCLDLHGATADDVRGELDRFLADAMESGWRCVKIIHGRGLRSVNGPVLKDAVVRRLAGRYRKDIVAFVSARQCDGGLGAMYVLLRR